MLKKEPAHGSVTLHPGLGQIYHRKVYANLAWRDITVLDHLRGRVCDYAEQAKVLCRTAVISHVDERAWLWLRAIVSPHLAAGRRSRPVSGHPVDGCRHRDEHDHAGEEEHNQLNQQCR
jgi:hypothetical protein